MAYRIGISCSGVPPLNYHWTVTEDAYDQREGTYGVMVAQGDEKSESNAKLAAEMWCDNKYSVQTKKLNKHYEYTPR